MSGEMMRRLGRSIGRKGRAFLSIDTNRFIISSTVSYNLSSSFNSLSSAPFLHISRCTHSIAENAENMSHKMEDEANGGSVSNPSILTTVLRKGKELVWGQRGLKEGDTVDLSDLLFSKDRDYLIKCNGSQQVKAEQLRGKAVVLYFDSLLHIDHLCLDPLTLVYNDLQPKNHFEVVFVDTNDDFDPSARYGAAGYPFDKATIDFLDSEDEKAVKNPTLKALLANRERDYLISNKGDKVPIDTLEDKVVALFFYTECKLHQEFTAKLKVAYKDLLQKDQKFEVVLIYLYDKQPTNYITSEETFSDTFKTMPWLALPFKDSNYKKLERLFFLAWYFERLDHALVIIGPHMEFIQPFGLDILWLFKSPAYPFTYERVAELVAEEAKKLKLAMLWETNSVFDRQYGSKVELSEFAGKRLIILYDWYPLQVENVLKFIETLKEKYDRFRSTDKEFEVIHITRESYSNEHVKNLNLPWVVEPVRNYRDEPKIFGIWGQYNKDRPSLLAFNEDGDIVRKTIYPTLKEKYFPFYTGGLEKEALSQLVEVFEWDWLQESYPETIYAYKKNCDRSIYSKLLELFRLK